MILDTGICTVFRRTAAQAAGGKPTYTWAKIYQSWYRELAFATVPDRPTDQKEETRVDQRVRVLQNRGIVNQDTVVLQACDAIPAGAAVFRVVRAYHGTDTDNGQPITDLSLEVSGV